MSGGGATLGYLGSSGSNLVLVSGPGSLWTNNGSLDWAKGPGNQLVVSNGGTVVSYQASIWNGGGASISGIGTAWNSTSFALGSVGVGAPSQLFVSGGAGVTNSGSCSIGSQSHSNSVLVTDPGTAMRIISNLQLGNQLVISNGAVVSAFFTYIANNGFTNQRLIITGASSLLTQQRDFYLGQSGPSNLLSVLDAGTLADSTGYIGGPGGFNQALISGTNTLWTNRAELYVGYASAQNQLVISNGATVCDTNGVIGNGSTAHSNTVVVAGAGSLWTNSSTLFVGWSGSFNQIFVTNGGTLVAKTAYIGVYAPISNRVTVADVGSTFGTEGVLTIGAQLSSRGSQLSVANGGTVKANGLVVGSPFVPNIPNSLLVNGGNIILTNIFGNNTLAVSNNGVVILNSGLLWANVLALDTGSNIFNFNGGTLRTSRFSRFLSTVVGNGSSLATLEFVGGTHNFQPSLTISSNATLKGTGSISGDVTINPGGTLAPGSSIGNITLNGNLLLSNGATNMMELNADNSTCDTIAGPTNLVYGGTLVLTNVAGVLTNGSSFRLFSASNYSGAFTALLPTAPGPGLKWNINELNVDGVLRVVALQSQPPKVAAVQVSGTNVLISASGGIPYDRCYLLTATNIGANAWEYLSTNKFDTAGSIIFNPLFSPIEPLRFFRLQVE
jgi:T5SS/PEP-CTERM-associated repeat protein